jgi:phosphatidate cytidylyltransferase
VNLDDPLTAATVIVVVLAGCGLVAAALFGVASRDRVDGLRPNVAIARAASYAGLAVGLVVAAQLGVPGIALFVALLSGVGLFEWARLFDLPVHHQISLVVGELVLVVGIGLRGVEAADWLVGALVLVGAAWPVLRADTQRGVRDLGFAAVGFVVIPTFLVHGLALAVEQGRPGIALFIAIAVGCAGADVAAFVLGRRFGIRPLASRLSPSKTRAGAVGNVIGAVAGIGPFAPALIPVYGSLYVLALVPVVAAGSLWGDLLESAVKREAGVKDAATWLPGFGGILDRIDSLLVTVALAYWLLRLQTVLE